jgi:hypothetical protein
MSRKRQLGRPQSVTVGLHRGTRQALNESDVGTRAGYFTADVIGLRLMVASSATRKKRAGYESESEITTFALNRSSECYFSAVRYAETGLD